MGLFSKDIKTFEDLFLHGLKDIYYAENQIVKTLPELIANASDSQLKQGLQQHLQETEHQVERLDQVFQLIGQEPEGTKCYGINGLLSEGDEIMGNVDDKKVLNAAVIAAAQAVEHYEITRYGSLIAWAEEMGRRDVANVLEANLAEEKAADQKLTKLAESRVNKMAEGKRPSANAGGRAAAARRSASARRSSSTGSASRRRSASGDRRKTSRK
jgi:ferritin-like metal-binding protein YciE